MTESDPRESLARLLRVMATLRGEAGCPWDRRQTHRTLIPYLIEEAYEVVDAIEGSEPDRNDGRALREELGDLLLQVVFHARIAEEEGRFDFHDVADAIADKLIERHPHVFAGAPIESAEALRRMWHEKKMASRRSALDGVPASLPALQRAAKVSAAAAQAGFEWHRLDQILEKCHEELEEFRREIARLPAQGAPAAGPPPTEAMETELGDLLFALVQLARWQRIDPESALRRATAKFIARFRWMEARLRERGQAVIPEAWEALWAEAKTAVPG
jgi:MazG family protein